MIKKVLAIASALFVALAYMPIIFCADPPSVRLEVRDSTRYYMRLKNLKQREPNNAKVVYELANYHYSIGNINEAIREYKRVLEIDSEHKYAKWFLSKCLVKKGYYEDAYWNVRDLLVRDKKNPELYEFAGEILMKMEEYGAAKQYFSKCDELVLGKKGNVPLEAKSKPHRGEWKKYFYN